MRWFALVLFLFGCAQSAIVEPEPKVLLSFAGGKELWMVRAIQSQKRIAWHGTEVVHRYQVLFHCQTTDTHPACFAAQYFIPTRWCAVLAARGEVSAWALLLEVRRYPHLCPHLWISLVPAPIAR